MSAWDDFARECAEWPAGGATLWWRDDDAASDTPALARLLSTTEDIPLALAVIPARLEAGLAPALNTAPITVLQHGYAHMNHAPSHEKKIELGPHRPFPHTLGDIAQGWARLEAVFGARARTILVPPWNRIAPALVPLLPEIGFMGLSTFGPRKRTEPVRGLVQANCHVDLIDWHGGRAFAGEERVLGALLRHLIARRTHQVPPEEPTGLLTHHLVHDDEAWQFLARLVQECRRQRAITWLVADEVFRPVTRRP